MKKKTCKGETGMGYCPFSSPARDIASCIATQGLGGRAGRAAGLAWPGTQPSRRAGVSGSSAYTAQRMRDMVLYCNTTFVSR